MPTLSVPAKGALLSLCTAVLWGVLPLFLLLCLQFMDSATITFYRFLSAGLFLLVILSARKQLMPVLAMGRKKLLITFIAAVFLVVNYVTNVMGLEYLSPGSVQLLMQIAPLALMAGGLVFYREAFNRKQLFGVMVLIVGLVLFFSERMPDILASSDEDPIGIVIIGFSALVWAAYALLQKGLLVNYSSNQINALLYLVGALILIPLTNFSAVLTLSLSAALALLFCCANTLLAYGAFAEALRIWDASRVSAVLAITPLVTLLSNAIASAIWPDIFSVPEKSSLAYVGASGVIVGSMACALSRPTRHDN